MATWYEVQNYLFRVHMQYRADYLNEALDDRLQQLIALASSNQAPQADLERELQIGARNRGSVGIIGPTGDTLPRVCDVELGDEGEWLRFEALVGELPYVDLVGAGAQLAARGRGGVIVNDADQVFVRCSVHLPSLTDLRTVFTCGAFVVDTATLMRRTHVDHELKRDHAEARALFHDPMLADFIAGVGPGASHTQNGIHAPHGQID